MSAVPMEPASPERAAQLLSTAAAGKRPQWASLGALDGLNSFMQERDARRQRAQIRLAAQDAADARLRAQIKALAPADATTHQFAVQDAAELLDAWRDGAVLGVHDFHSRLVRDQALISPALAGNLLWAATSITAVPFTVGLSFVGAILGTLGTIAPRYDAIIGPVTADVVARLNNLHDELLNRLDLLVFPLLRSRGYPAFAALTRPDQLALLWSGLFQVPASSGHYIEPTRFWLKARLDAADASAAARLAVLRRAWAASLRSAGSDYDPLFVLDRARWNQFTTDPVWLFAGHDVSWDQYRGPFVEPRTDEDARAAALLRLAIDVQFPGTP